VASPAAAVGLFLELAKARLATLVVLTAIAGYVVAARGGASLLAMTWTALGTALSAFGANILNQVWEVERDRRMERTRTRPIPSGRISRSTAAGWGVASSAAGVALLAVATNLLTAALSLACILLYVLVYTPLKPRTPLNTLIGAVCGAIPPVMGWTAATGRLESGAWILFGLLLLWQVPHFMALAWLYREDYARGGFRMLPAVDPGGGGTARFAFVYAAALLPLAAAGWAAGLSGQTFLVGSQLLGLAFAWTGWRFLTRRTDTAARRLFFASLLYLPLVLGLMVADMDDRVARGAFLGREPAALERVADRGAAAVVAPQGDLR
jgi:protoheme IX farnesyltransferase